MAGHSLDDNQDGFISIKREDGWVKKVPVEKILSATGEGGLDEFIETLPWVEPEPKDEPSATPD